MEKNGHWGRNAYFDDYYSLYYQMTEALHNTFLTL